MTNTNSLELPPEVLEHIMAYLRDVDPRCLRACAEVCSAWLWPARVHLFSHVHVKDGRAWDQLKDALVSTPSLAPLIRMFSVSDHKYFLWDAILRDTVVCTAISAASALRVLNISRSSVFPVAEWMDVLVLNASTLQMERVYFGNTTHLFHTITVRPYLRKLSLKDISVKFPVSGARIYAPRLEDLDIDSHVVHAFMDAPDAELNIAPRHLTVTSMDDDATLPLATLLRLIGSELQSFSMTVHEVILEPVWQLIPPEDSFLSHSLKLRHLHLVNASDSIFRLAPILFGILSPLMSEQLETIVIQLRIYRKQELVLRTTDTVQDEYPQLRELNVLLGEPRFGRLVRFHLDVHFTNVGYGNEWWSRTTTAELEDGVKLLFPELADRGVLQSTFHDPSEKGWMKPPADSVTEWIP